ncbi:MAG: TerB family tellurite resistance protein [Vicinamibacterales bacterium]|nr:TerB family tellurite resistance protein [Acidobacteriota bacterium]
MRSILSWLGLDRTDSGPEQTPLRELVTALDRLEPERAQYLARFAYLLGRVAHADRHVSEDETRTMERLVRQEGGLDADQAMLVVSLAKTSNQLFGGTADFIVAREFGGEATYEQKLALVRCLFALSAADSGISMAEESEIHRIANELRIDPADLTALRVAHQAHLPGLTSRPGGETR